jgi:IMP dehydrogenase
MFAKSLAFDDVLLKPRYSNITTRNDVDLSVDIGTGHPMRLPIFASPMDTVMSVSMATKIFHAGGRGILHRYCSVDEQVKSLRWALHPEHIIEVFAAIGVTDDWFDRALALTDNGATGLCIDVAHGHHRTVISAIERLKQSLPSTIHLMAGNVATLDGFNMLASAGADSIRVGVGGGSICSTRVQTGHGVPTFQSVLECSASEYDCLLVADGGIKNSGDIVKALAAGADAVMIGSMLAGTDESPGEIMKSLGTAPMKVYRGMASPEAQIAWRGKYSSNEGVSRAVPLKGPVTAVLYEIDKAIRSGLSYSGARNIRELQAKSEFIIQTSAGAKESSTHIDG